jgi:predicted nuclease with TOPRIM domain
LEAVKLKVGGGSYTTLTRALREWRKEKDRQQTAVEAPPEIVSDLAQRLAGDLWKAATAEAQMGLAAAREALNLENKRLQEEMTEVLRSADLMATQIQSRAEELQAKLEEASRGRSDAETQLQVQTTKVVNLEERVSELRKELADAKSASTPSSLHDEIQSLRSQLSTLTEQNAKILAKE